jgi:hypothetical protein
MHSMLLRFCLLFCAAICLTACSTATRQPYDYTMYKQSQPRSILVLPPLNNSLDVNATYGMLAQATYPLAESGYYVFPVALADETFKQNGMTSSADIHAVAPAKLREIFGADSALYITVTQYGVTYSVIDSTVVVSAEAKLVDLKTGNQIWQGSATASSAEDGNSSGGGLAGILITAVVKQIANNITDSSYHMAGRTGYRLLAAGHPNGILYGPRSPRFGTDSGKD